MAGSPQGWLLAILLAGRATVALADAPFADPQTLASSTLLSHVSAAVDVDGDGDLDLVGHGDDHVRWLEQGPLGTYSLRSIYTFPAGSIVYEMTIGDVDGDGDPDLVTYRQNDEEDAYVEWLENDGTPNNGTWTKRQIGWWDAGFLVFEHDTDGLVVADVDGDGDLDVFSGLGEVATTTSNRDGRIDWWENDGAAVPGWSRHTVQDWWDERVPLALAAGDVDGDGDVDLAASIPRCDTGGTGYIYWYTNDGTPANGAWSRHEVDPGVCGPELTSLAAGDLDRDGDLDLVGKDRLGPLVRYANDGSPDGAWPSVWSYPDGEDAGLADLDGDGWLDIVLAFPASWQENRGGTFVAHDLPGSPTYLQQVGDLDGDGDPDLAWSDFGTIRWNENLTIHRVAHPMPETVIDGTVTAAFDVFAADLDRDGDLDMVSASEAGDRIVLHRNDGSPGDGGWTNVSAAVAVDGARAVAAGDLDGDGDLDLVAAAYNENGVLWYESDGTPFDGGWTERSISAGAGGANDVLLADFDDDGDLDIACAQYLDDEISWYRNNGGSPPTFSAFFVDSVAYDGPRALAAGDLDGDGDLDLAAVSENADAVVWYTNDGTPADGEWFRHRTDNGESDGPKDVALADLDGDGDLDTLVANYVGDDALWYENDGTFAGWTARTITTCGGARGLAAGDFDNDGDLDVFLSCYDEGRVKLQSSNGGSPPVLTATVSSITGAGGARSVVAADLDRDGDLDGAVAQGADDQIAWYENHSGQFRVTASSVAAGPLANDLLQPVFNAQVQHRGRSGDTEVELAAVAVRLEEAPGAPLNAFAAVSAIDAVRVYRDDGDSVFEPGIDPFLASGGVAGISIYGDVWVDLPDGAAIAAVSYGEVARYFVVLSLAQPPGFAAPDTLRVTLLTEGGSATCEADDRDYDLPLDLEWSSSVSTATLELMSLYFRDGFENGATTRWSRTRP